MRQFTVVSSSSSASFAVQEQSVHEFKGQQFMDFSSIVAVALEVTSNHLLKSASLKIGPSKASRVEQHFPNIPRQGIPVPRSEMEDFVPPKK